MILAGAAQAWAYTCGTTLSVRKPVGSSPYSTIQAAVNAIPASYSANYCIIVDSSTYSEQVTVQNKVPTANTYRITIMSDPGLAASTCSRVSPTSGAAFYIYNSSVSLLDIRIETSNNVTYGVESTGQFVEISSVSMTLLGTVSTAGMSLYNWNTLSYSSITIANANAIRLFNSSGTTISLSTGMVTSGSNAALALSNASSNTITGMFLQSAAGNGLSLDGSENNFISRSFLSGDGYYGSIFDAASDSNTITLSTMTGAYNGIYLLNSASNTIRDSFIYGATRSAALINGSNYTTITNSTMTANFAAANNYGSLHINASFSANIDRCFIHTPIGDYGALIMYSSSNSITNSTITCASSNGMYARQASSNTISNNFIYGYDNGLYIWDHSEANVVRTSTIMGPNNYGLTLLTTSSNTVDQCFISGYEAAYLSNISSATITNSTMSASSLGLDIYRSTAITISGSYIQSQNSHGALFDGAGEISLLGNRIQGAPLSSGLNFRAGPGPLFISSNTIMPGAKYGIYILTQPADAQVWITSNTILPTISNARTTYGIFLDNLTSGATIYNNGFYYRSPGNNGSYTTYGIYSLNSSGINLHHNRISNPGMLTGGNVVNAYFTGSTGIDFDFNDVNSTGTGLTNAYLLQLAASTVSAHNNIFLSSWPVSGTAANLTMLANSGLDSDYNDWFSSGTSRMATWGANYTTLAAWQATAKDADSIAANPYWYNTSANVEDFHPMSTTGRYSSATGDLTSTDGMDSPTIDAADNLEPYDNEPPPHGSNANLGSYGNTAEASLSNAYCAIQRNVHQANGPYKTIQSAVNALPHNLTGPACVVIKDNATYPENVTVEGFTHNNSSITITLDPALSLHPTVAPTGGDAAFTIRQTSVNILNLDIKPTNSVSYGIWASSPLITISSVNVDGGNKITGAGMNLASWNTLSYSSITVQDAHGIYLPASSMTTVAYSTAVNASASYFAMHLSAASSCTIVGLFASNSLESTIRIDSGGSHKISQSSVTCSDSYSYPIYINASSSNTITTSLFTHTNLGYGMLLAGNYNDISFSTISSFAKSALYITGGSYNTIRKVLATAPQEGGVELISNSNFNAIEDSTLNGLYGFYTSASDSNTVTRSVLFSTSGYGAYLDDGSEGNIISFSTITADGGVAGSITYGVYQYRASSNTITDSYIQGPRGVYIYNTTSTVVSNSVIVATNTAGYGVYASYGAVNMTLSSNTFISGGQGTGVYLYSGAPYHQGLMTISSNIFKASGQYGIRIGAMVNARVIIASNTIEIPATSAFTPTYGIYLSGLTTGATIYNNGLYRRTAATNTGSTAYGLYVQNSAGINFHHNRINNPGLTTGGSAINAYFTGSSAGIDFNFNDVNSTGTGMSTAYLLQLNNSTITARNNIFLSSWTAGANFANLSMNAPGSGINSDYNDWFSSGTSRMATWGTPTYTTLAAWKAAGEDANSISAHPYWHDTSANIEDFHPMSQAADGRFNPISNAFDGTDPVTSLTIDAADPAEPLSSYVSLPPTNLGAEPADNGARANQGSYGQTDQASLSYTAPFIAPTGCGLVKNVIQNNTGDYTRIQPALAALPNNLPTTTCIVVRDTQTYSEQITVEGFTFTYTTDTLRIMSDPSFVSSAPIIIPPQASYAGFWVKNSSVSLEHLTVITTNTVTYGVLASSSLISISSVNVDGAWGGGGYINVAGISLSSWNYLGYSSVTVNGSRHALSLTGSTMTRVEFSSAQANSAAYYALYLNGASSNTFTVFLASNPTGIAANMNRSRYNTIDRSTMVTVSGGAAIDLVASSSNTITRSYLSSIGTYGLVWESASNGNNISLSTVANTGNYGIYINNSSSNTVSQCLVFGNGGHNIFMTNTANYNTISRSSVTAANGSLTPILINNSSSNTISQCYVSNTAGNGLGIIGGSQYNTVDLSTITGNVYGYAALDIDNASYNT
ncbi:MAG: right-handed parallel beta-helix repeat-containing protein, partial [Elusimicrobiota bacterium]